jgi:hypothetical protein
MNGILAIWHDCVAGAEPDYESWYTSEHLVERLNVPGFLRGWRYEAVDADPRFFTYYDTETVEVLSSPAYLERLDHPTPWTRRIMQSAFRLVSRTVCELTACSGALAGSHVVTLRWDTGVRPSAPGEVAMRLAGCDEVARAQAWTAARTQTPQTEEARVRGGQDALIGGAIVADCLREADARAVSARLASEGYLDALGCADRCTIGIYRLLCMLPRAG